MSDGLGWVQRETPEPVLLHQLSQCETLLEAFNLTLKILRDLGYHAFAGAVVQMQLDLAKATPSTRKQGDLTWDELVEIIIAAREAARDEELGPYTPHGRTLLKTGINRDLRALQAVWSGPWPDE